MKNFALLPFEKEAKERFFNTLRPSAINGTELIYTSADWRDGTGEAGGYIHIEWNRMVALYWAHINHIRLRYYVCIGIVFAVGIFIGRIF